MQNITYCLNFLAELGVQVDGLGAKGKSRNVYHFLYLTGDTPMSYYLVTLFSRILLHNQLNFGLLCKIRKWGAALCGYKSNKIRSQAESRKEILKCCQSGYAKIPLQLNLLQQSLYYSFPNCILLGNDLYCCSFVQDSWYATKRVNRHSLIF